MNTRKIRILVVVLAIVSLAWASYPGTPEVPYTGTYSRQYITNGVWTKAQSIKWNSDGVWWMRNNVWSEVFDQTADCTSNSPAGDKLRPIYVVTDIPNNGGSSFNDCDGPLPNINEEFELYLNPNSIGAETPYVYEVKWQCNGANISGEVNITFEMDLFGGKYWLDKKVYAIEPCTGPATAPAMIESQSPQQPGSGGEDDKTSITGEPLPKKETELLWSVQSSDDTYKYHVLRTDQGKTRVRLLVDFHRPGIFERYRELNASLINTLQRNDRPIKIVVTFSSPVSVIEAQEIVEQSGMTILSYGSSGRGASNRLTFVYSFPESGLIEGTPDVPGVQIDGIMVLTGIVKRDIDKLVSLANNPRVALVDVIYDTIRRDVEAALGQSVELDQIGITTPAWHIAAREITP